MPPHEVARQLEPSNCVYQTPALMRQKPKKDLPTKSHPPAIIPTQVAREQVITASFATSQNQTTDLGTSHLLPVTAFLSSSAHLHEENRPKILLPKRQHSLSSLLGRIMFPIRASRFWAVVSVWRCRSPNPDGETRPRRQLLWSRFNPLLPGARSGIRPLGPKWDFFGVVDRGH
jgi:hypothetical protein